MASNFVRQTVQTIPLITQSSTAATADDRPTSSIIRSSLTSTAAEGLLQVNHVVHQLQSALVIDADGTTPSKLPYTSFVRHMFESDPLAASGRHVLNNDRRAQLLAIVESSIIDNICNHPYLYASEADLWGLWAPEVRSDEYSAASAAAAESETRVSDCDSHSNRWLTEAGTALAVEAWCQDSHVHVTRYTEEEHFRLRFWRCHGSHIIRLVFRQPPVAIGIAAAGTPRQDLLPLRMSHLHFRDSLRRFEQEQMRAAPHANRPRYARFSRIQAYGLNMDPATGQPAAAFFVPAQQILAHMSNYFRSSSVFEMPKASRNEFLNVRHAKFTNLMLLNVCGEVMRQITALFRMHEASAEPDDFLIKADDVYLLQHSTQLQTSSEQILRREEPDIWLTGMNATLQRAVGTFAPHAAVARPGSFEPPPRSRAAASAAEIGPGRLPARSPMSSTQTVTRLRNLNFKRTRVYTSESGRTPGPGPLIPASEWYSFDPSCRSRGQPQTAQTPRARSGMLDNYASESPIVSTSIPRITLSSSKSAVLDSDSEAGIDNAVAAAAAAAPAPAGTVPQLLPDDATSDADSIMSTSTEPDCG